MRFNHHWANEMLSGLGQLNAVASATPDGIDGGVQQTQGARNDDCNAEHDVGGRRRHRDTFFPFILSEDSGPFVDLTRSGLGYSNEASGAARRDGDFPCDALP